MYLQTLYHTEFCSFNLKKMHLPLNNKWSRGFSDLKIFSQRKRKIMVYYCFPIMIQYIQKIDWEKLYSLLPHIIQHKSNSFRPAFILNLSFAQVRLWGSAPARNSQQWWVLYSCVIKGTSKIKNRKLSCPYRQSRSAGNLLHCL